MTPRDTGPISRETLLPPAVHEPGTDVAAAMRRARRALLESQRETGEWCYELEADCTISAEYVIMLHFLGQRDEALEADIARYLRARQAEHGGWPLYYGGSFDVSCSVKTYWALKLAGDDPDAPHMVRAREAILAHGGAARCNVFTRITMALFRQVPWRAVPVMPVELVLLPRWFPFHLSKVSYWSRTVMVPLTILCSIRAAAVNPTGVDLKELFTEPPDRVKNYFRVRSRLNRVFLAVERTARRLEFLVPRIVRKRALRRAEQWIRDRLEDSDGLGAIFPAVVNAYEAFVALGRPADDPALEQCRAALEGLLVKREEGTYCQPCQSPTWDTALACLALTDAQAVEFDARTQQALDRACRWLVSKQVLDGPADWRQARPDLAPGGWPFQYANARYSDLDDTSAVAWALLVQDPVAYEAAISRAADWLCGMQSSNGGFASFDVDNCYDYLSEIPFADHGALLDPPTADVTGRCIAFLGRLGRPGDAGVRRRAIANLCGEQEADGSWFGRWGTNYIYGVWSALTGIAPLRDPALEPRIARAVAWLGRVQRADGSWGETNDSYADARLAGQAEAGTSFQTAWAVLALMAAGQARSPEVRRGISYLVETQCEDATWHDPWYTAPGFPRVFYLKYHGYSAYFPLWALAAYLGAHANE